MSSALNQVSCSRVNAQSITVKEPVGVLVTHSGADMGFPRRGTSGALCGSSGFAQAARSASMARVILVRMVVVLAFMVEAPFSSRNQFRPIAQVATVFAQRGCTIVRIRIHRLPCTGFRDILSDRTHTFHGEAHATSIREA